MTQAAWLGEIAWKGTVILTAAFASAALLRGASAAARHFLWTAMFGALLALPVAISVAPRWNMQPPVGAAPAGEVQTAPAVMTHSPVKPGPKTPSRPPWLPLWALGCAAAAARFATGFARTRWILRGAQAAGYAQGPAEELGRALGIRRRVTVLEAPDAPVPLTCGLAQPAIVLPRGAAAWPEARLRSVLRHELAHIRRHDLVAQAVGQAACCVYWFHPLAWIAARQLRRERERACDDVVITSGTPAHEYAACLVDVARGLAARRRAWADAPAMAGSCDLESRIRALFDHRRNRRPLGRRAAAAVGMAALAVLFPMASLSVHAQAARGSLAGVVQDASRARVPDCEVVAKNEDASNQEATRTNAVGEYRFGAIPPGNYVVEFRAAGFALTKMTAAVLSGQAAGLDATLNMDTVSDHMTIRGQRPPTAARPPGAGTPERIRVGGNVEPARLVQRTAPAYPADLQQLGIEGIVVIRAVISMDGSVLSPQVVNTDIDPRLAQLALDAVRQWRYRPALLNGEPVETTTTLMVDFTLDARNAKSRR